MILSPTYKYVDTFIIVHCKKPRSLEKPCAIKRTFKLQLAFFCF